MVYQFVYNLLLGTNESQKVKFSVKPKHPNRSQNLWLPVNEFSCLVTER